MVSPEMAVITKEAETSALRQSTRAELDDFLRRMAQPLEPASQGILDIARTISRPLNDGEVFGSVGMTNAVLRNWDQPAPADEPIGEGGYLSDGFGSIKKG